MDNQTPAGDRIPLAVHAQKTIRGWSAGAQAIALLTAVHEQGWTTLLAQPQDLHHVAKVTGLTPERLAGVVTALVTHGLAEQTDGQVQLSPWVAEVLRGDSAIALDNVMNEAAMMPRLVRRAAYPGDGRPVGTFDAVTIAHGHAIRSTPVSAVAIRNQMTFRPEVAAAIEHGRLLDVGCGVAGMTLTMTAFLYPEMRAVGIEIDAGVAAAARDRAALLGVSDRVEIRTADAQELTEIAAFDAAFWAQPFFAEPARVTTLANILRALKPGGILTEQEYEVEPVDEADRPAFALRRMIFEGWGVPFARTAEDLAAEAVAVGFELVRIGETPLGRQVLLRKPAV